MKAKELILKLLEYDGEKEVYFMKEHNDADITIADEIHKVEQRTLSKDAFEYEEFVAIILLHELKNNQP